MQITRRHMAIGLAVSTLLRPAMVRSAELAELDMHPKNLTGDLDTMLDRGIVRMLVPYSRTFFYQTGGDFHGVAAEIGDELEKWLRHTYPALKQKLVVTIVPTSRDRLIPDLLAGHGDVAVGDITITPERQKLVAFSNPTFTGIKELVATKAGVPPMASADDLSGREIAARPGTSTYASIMALNDKLKAAGRPPAIILDLPGALEAEDMLDMLEAGLLPAMPVEEWLFDLWGSHMPGIMLNHSAVLRAGASVGWAIRRDNPALQTALNNFLAKAGGTGQNLRDTVTYYLKEAKKLHGATRPDDMKRFEVLLGYFKKYGPEYGFDSLMLVAQGYQESQLDQSTHSPSGAIGVMQLLPQTGKDMSVGDISQIEPNVHAGAKYMRYLIDTYLKDGEFDEQNRTLFAFACYNAGPNKIAQLRKQARDEGLNPNQWFDNVERIAAKKIGQETVRYVRNIYKYYIGYKLVAESQQRIAASKAAAPPQ
jgi:membrane-bound lytic murein transglycosylase MltF